MTSLARWGYVLALLPIAACSSNSQPTTAAAPPAPPPLSAQDANFVTMAAEGGLAEIQDGTLAAKQAGRPAVRQFGQKMVDDHTPNNQQLLTLATAKGVTPSSTLNDADQAMLTKLNSLHGRAFDMAYLKGQIDGHTAMAAAMQSEISDGTDADLKAFATSTLPVVQQHLAMAQRLAGVRPMHAAPAKVMKKPTS